MTITVHRELIQGTDEWLDARCGLLTASTIGRLITTTLKVADNDTSRGLVHTLAAERITKHVDYIHPTFDMQRGTDDEPFARAVYADNYAPVEEVGFITRETGTYTLGYSPDGLVGDDGLIEIKSRRPKEQILALVTRRVPGANMAQLQAGLFVTGRHWIDYVSYAAGLPMFVSRVTPDAGWFAAIDAAATQFEQSIAAVIDEFATAAALFPATERHPALDEINI